VPVIFGKTGLFRSAVPDHLNFLIAVDFNSFSFKVKNIFISEDKSSFRLRRKTARPSPSVTFPAAFSLNHERRNPADQRREPTGA